MTNPTATAAAATLLAHFNNEAPASLIARFPAMRDLVELEMVRALGADGYIMLRRHGLGLPRMGRTERNAVVAQFEANERSGRAAAERAEIARRGAEFAAHVASQARNANRW